MNITLNTTDKIITINKSISLLNFNELIDKLYGIDIIDATWVIESSSDDIYPIQPYYFKPFNTTCTSCTTAGCICGN